MKKVILSLALVFSASISFASGSYCVGSGYMMPDFGLSYTYNAGCSWTKKTIAYSRMVPFYVSEKTMKSLKEKVTQDLSKLGVQPIANLNGFTIYSNTPRANGEVFCIINPKSLGGFNSIACDEGIKLSTDALNKEDNAQMLLNNGFSKITDVQNVADWGGGYYSVSIFSKK